MSSTDYRLTSNVSRERSFNSGCVIRSTRQRSSNRLSEMSGQFESGITIALSHRSTATSSSGFGSAPAKNTIISSGSCSDCKRLLRSELLGQFYLLSRKCLSSVEWSACARRVRIQLLAWGKRPGNEISKRTSAESAPQFGSTTTP